VERNPPVAEAQGTGRALLFRTPRDGVLRPGGTARSTVPAAGPSPSCAAAGAGGSGDRKAVQTGRRWPRPAAQPAPGLPLSCPGLTQNNRLSSKKTSCRQALGAEGTAGTPRLPSHPALRRGCKLSGDIQDSPGRGPVHPEVTLLGQRVGLGDPQRAVPTPTMLGFWVEQEAGSEGQQGAGLRGKHQAAGSRCTGGEQHGTGTGCSAQPPPLHSISRCSSSASDLVPSGSGCQRSGAAPALGQRPPFASAPRKGSDGGCLPKLTQIPSVLLQFSGWEIPGQVRDGLLPQFPSSPRGMRTRLSSAWQFWVGYGGKAGGKPKPVAKWGAESAPFQRGAGSRVCNRGVQPAVPPSCAAAQEGGSGPPAVGRGVRGAHAVSGGCHQSPHPGSGRPPGHSFPRGHRAGVLGGFPAAPNPPVGIRPGDQLLVGIHPGEQPLFAAVPAPPGCPGHGDKGPTEPPPLPGNF